MCSSKDLQNFIRRSSALYTSFLFSIPTNIHILDTEYAQGKSVPTFVVDDFPELFLYQSVFLIKDSRYA